VNLLVKMRELATGIAQEELAFDPDGQAKNVYKEQRAVCRNGLPVAVKDQVTSRNEEL
jgi:hypothetical protein